MKYEVFDPRNGTPLWTTRYLWIARVTVWLFGKLWPMGLDYAKEGAGW